MTIPELQQPTLPPSLWTAGQPAWSGPTLAPGGHEADVVIIGAGFTGLSAALHLAERGRTVMVVEAGEPGWGASGRNGGQVIPGLKEDPDDLERRFGADLVGLAGGSADMLFDLVARHGIDCDARRSGWVQAAHAPDALAVAQARARQWQKRGAEVTLLDRGQIGSLLGASGYVGGWVDHRGGSVQPFRYARGLADAAIRLGAQVFARTRVTGLEKVGAGWRIAIEGGRTIQAAQVILATNGYSEDLWPGLRTSIVPVYSFQLATAPLSENVRASVLPGRHVVSETRRMMAYFRTDEQGRLLMGGRGPFVDRPTLDDTQSLKRMVQRIFPQVPLEEPQFWWGGRIAMTLDHLPHLHVLAPGLFAGLGYNGRGVAMATVMGRLLADLATGTPAGALPFPVSRPRSIPFHGLRRPVMELLFRWYALRDDAEARRAG
ncbi:NAD(P)/FAD-dependent oxidoreductase [Zavarzinia sp. CC-PAN008]|uniref:NAD(P)/FAD-dependent oxidoreductase n=1 Tax=Zavarzinia sp. CC-PAN008 TaxID=3243332 RepID=UPI003F7426FD